MKLKTPHRLIFKIESSRLKRSNWNLNLTLEQAVKTCPDVVVALNDSQCLRFIDKINGVDPDGRNERIKAIQREINRIKKQPKTRTSGKIISELYAELYNLQFQRDYVCVVMANNTDYDRANKGFIINGIRYRRFLGTNGGIKNSTIVYVSESVYPELKRRLDNGRNVKKEIVPAKLEAYQALICSGSVPLPEPKGIIVVKDCLTHFKEDIYFIEDAEKGEEPKPKYIKDYEFEHNNSDGYGLMLPQYSKKVNGDLTGDYENTISGLNCRYAWCKGMLFTFDYIKFAEEYADSCYEITDVWGAKRDIRDAEVILTESMLKLWDSYNSVEDYFTNCKANQYEFSASKVAPVKLENVRYTNYQFLQSYRFTDEELRTLCSPTSNEIKDVLIFDSQKTVAFLAGLGLDEDTAFSNSQSVIAKALMVEPNMINDSFIRRKIYGMIKKRIEMGKRGAITVNGNFCIISGDPFALCQSIFGLPITGILKAGEVYHKYWIDKGAEEIVCFRSPMTGHNNIRRMRLNYGDLAAKWFRYMDTVLIYNAWDSATEAENGADFDSDTNMCTNNPILLKNTLNEPTIVCVQRKAVKKVPTEDDIIAANKLAFNDDIGVITNRVTAMFEVQAGFNEKNVEYSILRDRIMCGQHYQQCSIDRAKGVIAEPMPEYWYNPKKCNDDLNKKVVASKKPYFMIYVYQDLKRDYIKFTTGCDRNIARLFGRYNIYSINDLRRAVNECNLDLQVLKDMQDFIRFYDLLIPTGNHACIVNKIAWFFEDEFQSEKLKMPKADSFDYTIMKSGLDYSASDFAKIQRIYDDYILFEADYQTFRRRNKANSEEDAIQYQLRINNFKRRCEEVCSDSILLCDMILDLCYQTERAKQFAWDICGDTIVENLLRKKNGEAKYPFHVEDGEDYDFIFRGERFKMKPLVVEVD